MHPDACGLASCFQAFLSFIVKLAKLYFAYDEEKWCSI